MWKKFCVLGLPILFAFLLPLQGQHPKLIVVVIVDQMRGDYLDRFGTYETGGLHFFNARGANFINANYEHTPTETCVGHSVLLSGRNPARTGIVANEWYDRETGRMIYCVEDANSPLIGETGTAVSPKNILGANFADWLQSSYPGARVISISLKDRAAIAMAGHHPQAVLWFSHQTGNFTTSRYYGDQVPIWAQEFNGRHMVDSYAGQQWAPLLASDSPAYHTRQVDGQFPHTMPKDPGPLLNDAVYGSPYGDELLEALAEHAIKINQLGENPADAPDLLAIGFSSNDAIGHTYGPDSPEIADEQIRLDRTLGHLMEVLNMRLGADNILWVLSADHGVEPAPEAERQLRGNKAARRLPFSAALESIQSQLNATFKIKGEMHWFAGQTDAMLYFDRAELARHNIPLAAASRALAKRVKNVPGIHGFYDATHLNSHLGWVGPILKNSAFPAHSGDVYYLPNQWTLFSSNPSGASHGDPWPYDTHVPLVLAGWHVKAQRIAETVQVADLAPTLAALTGVHWPISEVLDGKSRKDLLKVDDRYVKTSSTRLGRMESARSPTRMPAHGPSGSRRTGEVAISSPKAHSEMPEE
jgi:predicted AlkP superfamily pyrophosphatase or phosphodiesterase